MRTLPILFGAGFTAATAWALGRLLISRLKVRLYREEEHLIAFVAGSAILSMLVFVIGSVKLIYDATFLTVGAAAIALAWRTGAMKRSDQRLTALPALWKRLFLLVYLPFAVVVLVYALAPETSPDGSSYHLGIMARYYREHGFVAMPWQMYAQLSQGIDLLFLFAFAFGRHSAAAVFHCLFLLSLPWLVLRFGQRAGRPAAGAAAGLFVFIAPVVQLDGACAYNDVALAMLIFTGFYLLEISRDTVQTGMPILLGLLAGFCYGVKYTAFLAVPYAFVRLALQLWKQRLPRLRPLLLFSACVALMVTPWMARNALMYENPFAPLLNRWFPNPTNHVSFEDSYSKYMRNYAGLKSYADLPMELTVRGEALTGLVGPLFLLSPLALFALRSALGRRVLLAALVFGSTYALNVGTRFVIPALPFIALALALAMPAWRAILPALILFHAVTSWHRFVPLYSSPHAWRITEFRWKPIFSTKRADRWIAETFPGYRIARMVERMTPANAVIFAFDPMAESYTTRETRVFYQSALGERFFEQFAVAREFDSQPVHGEQFQFPRQRLRKLRVAQLGTHREHSWSVAEIRVKDGERELPRGPEWRLTAQPYPWDVQLAFDNSPLTRWSSWQHLEPNMFVEIDLGRLQTVSEVMVEMSADQWSSKMQVEGMGHDGKWRVLAEEPRIVGLPPQLEMRRAATEDMKRAGVTHLLVSEGDIGWDDFRDKRELWGLQLVEESGRSRLYRLE